MSYHVHIDRGSFTTARVIVVGRATTGLLLLLLSSTNRFASSFGVVHHRTRCVPSSSLMSATPHSRFRNILGCASFRSKEHKWMPVVRGGLTSGAFKGGLQDRCCRRRQLRYASFSRRKLSPLDTSRAVSPSATVEAPATHADEKDIMRRSSTDTYCTGTLISYCYGGPGACLVASIRVSDESEVEQKGTTVVGGSDSTTVDPAKASIADLFARMDITPDTSNASQNSHGQMLSKAEKGKKKREGDDLVGRTVLLKVEKGGERWITIEGLLIAQRYPVAFVLFQPGKGNDYLGDVEFIKDKDRIQVEVLRRTRNVYPNETWKGSMIDCFGNICDRNGIEPISHSEDSNEKLKGRPIFAAIPRVSDIALINSPLITGCTMVDALAPIGRGQNMLVIGERGTGKRGLAVDAVACQFRNKRGASRCVYACTAATVAEREVVISSLRDAGVMDDITLVCMRDRGGNRSEGERSVSPENLAVVDAAEAIAVSAAACAVAEFWALSQGEDTLVIVDNLDPFKHFWDYTTRELVSVYGEEAVVKEDTNGGASSEMRAFYSALVQRAGRYNRRRGGGSVTLALLVSLPQHRDATTEKKEEVAYSEEDFEGFNPKIKERIKLMTKRGIKVTSEVLHKLQIPLPPTKSSTDERNRMYALRHVDDLISMSDGQIWLSESAMAAGQCPPLDAQRSITRVGIGADTQSRADAPALRDLVGGLRFEFAQAAALEGLEDAAARKQLLRRDAWLLAMHQPTGSGTRSLAEECACLVAARDGHLDIFVQGGTVAGTSAGCELMKKLVRHVRKTVPEIVADIDESFELSTSSRVGLQECVRLFFHDHREREVMNAFGT